MELLAKINRKTERADAIIFRAEGFEEEKLLTDLSKLVQSIPLTVTFSQQGTEDVCCEFDLG